MTYHLKRGEKIHKRTQQLLKSSHPSLESWAPRRSRGETAPLFRRAAREARPLRAAAPVGAAESLLRMRTYHDSTAAVLRHGGFGERAIGTSVGAEPRFPKSQPPSLR